MKSELLYSEKFESTEDLINSLEKSIDYYNNKKQIKWKEPGVAPGSYTRNIIF